jgi:hypothetical protein
VSSPSVLAQQGAVPALSYLPLKGLEQLPEKFLTQAGVYTLVKLVNSLMVLALLLVAGEDGWVAKTREISRRSTKSKERTRLGLWAGSFGAGFFYGMRLN